MESAGHDYEVELDEEEEEEEEELFRIIHDRGHDS